MLDIQTQPSRIIMKLPKIASQEQGSSIININKLVSFTSFKKELWCDNSAEALAKLDDNRLFKRLCYYLAFRQLFQARKYESLSGYKPSMRYMPHQMANPNQESVIWSVVNSRPTLRAFLEINTLFVEV